MQIILDSLFSGMGEGLIWALLAIGVYLSYRVLDFADLGTEGTIITGASVTAVLIVKFGCDPLLATLAACLAGAVCGCVTGILHTKLHIAPILAGILTMTALYSINIRIMGSSTINITPDKKTIMTVFKNLTHLTTREAMPIIGVLFVSGVIALVYLFFGTQIGSAIRATGSNEYMCRAEGINTDNTKILGLAIANAIIALAGSVLVQCVWASSNYSYGVGTIVIGLASIIIGETVFHRARSFWAKLIGVTVGAIIYRVIISVIVYTNFMESSDLKLFSAIVVAVALSIPTIKHTYETIRVKRRHVREMPDEVRASLAGKEDK